MSLYQYIEVQELEIDNPLIRLGTQYAGPGASDDTHDLGFVSQYWNGTSAIYTGFFRDASLSGRYRLFDGLQELPQVFPGTVNTAGTGYQDADLQVGNLYTSGAAVISGDLTVNGTTTTINSTTLLVEDNFIVANVGPTGMKDDGGFIVKRPSVNITTDDPLKQSGTASAAGTTTTITLQAANGHGTVLNYYQGWSILVGGDISGYAYVTSSTATNPPTLTLDTAFSGASTTATTYELFNKTYVGGVWDETTGYWTMYGFPREVGVDAIHLAGTAGDGNLADYLNFMANNVYVQGALTATTGISLLNGNIDVVAGGVTASANITSTAGNLVATAGGVVAFANITSTTGNLVATSGGVSANANITTINGNLVATTGGVSANTNITTSNGSVTALGNITSTAGNVVAFANVVSTTGYLVATTGGVSANLDITTSNGGVTAFSNITSTAGNVVAFANVVSTTGYLVATTGGVSANLDITTSNGGVTAFSNITSTAGNVVAFANVVSTTGYLVATTGGVSANTNITTSNGGVTAFSNITSTAGNVVAFANVVSTTGNLVATTGGVSANTNITTSNGGVTAFGNITSTNGNLVAQNGNLFVNGNANITGSLYLGGNLYSSGNIRLDTNILQINEGPVHQHDDGGYVVKRPVANVVLDTPTQTGTASASGTTTTITLASGGGTTLDFYEGWIISLGGDVTLASATVLSSTATNPATLTLDTAASAATTTATTYNLYNKSFVGPIWHENNKAIALYGMPRGQYESPIEPLNPNGNYAEYLDLYVHNLVATGTVTTGGITHPTLTQAAAYTFTVTDITTHDVIYLNPTTSVTTYTLPTISALALAANTATITYFINIHPTNQAVLQAGGSDFIDVGKTSRTLKRQFEKFALIASYTGTVPAYWLIA